GDPLSPFARAVVLGVHLLHRLQGQFRRVQGDGACALGRAEVCTSDHGQSDRYSSGRLVPHEHGLLRLLHRPDDDEREVRRAVRRQAAQAGGAAHPARHGSGGVDSGRHRGDRAAPDARARGTKWTEKPVPRRRRRAQLRRQGPRAARREVRRDLDPAGGGRCGRGGRRGACDLLPGERRGASEPRQGRDARVIPRDLKFDEIWIQPAAGDAGGAVGAALATYYLASGAARPNGGKDGMRGSYLGPSYSEEDVVARLKSVGARYQLMGEESLVYEVARALA